MTFRDAWWSFIGDVGVVSIVALPIAALVYWWGFWVQAKPHDDAIVPAVFAAAIVYALALFVALFHTGGWMV